MSRVATAEGFPVQEQSRLTGSDVFTGLIVDAYQAECERFDVEMEKVDGEVFACCHDLQRAAGTPRMRALADRLIKTEEAAAGVRNRGFFVAGIAAGIRIAILAGLTDTATRHE